MTQLTPHELLLLRRRAQERLSDYAGFIEIPGRPVGDGDTFAQVETNMALHHRVICDAIQRTMERRYGRLLIFAPPGSAKSSMASIVAPTWIMGKKPGTRVIIAGHNSDIATTQSKKARQICKSTRYGTLFDTSIPADQRAADEWALTNGSTMIAGGILSGIAGHRVDGIVFDDPHPSREAAESETQRKKVWEEWRDNLRNRVTPGGWVVGMLTRWHEQDWAGMILPAGWKGESGMFRGTDGLDWEVLCLKAKIETEEDARTDPLGRAVGEYIWPEWFTIEHWQQKDPALGARDANTPSGRRSWYSMEQQVPHPDDGVLFRREDFMWYDQEEEMPRGLKLYAAGDWATTDDLLKPDPDWTEVGIGGWTDGRDHDGVPQLFFVDWYRERKDIDVTVPKFLRLIDKYRNRLRGYFGEQGVIETLLWPTVTRDARDAKPRRIILPPRTLLKTAGQGNKVVKAGAFRKLVEERRVWLPIGAPWAEHLVDQCCAFPGGSHDDAVDVGALFGRAQDQMLNAPGAVRPEEREPVLTPLTYEWHERMMRDEAAERRRRAEDFE